MPARERARKLGLALLAVGPLCFGLPAVYLQDAQGVLAEARRFSWGALWAGYWQTGEGAWQAPRNLYRPLALTLLRAADALGGANGARVLAILTHLATTLLLYAFLRRLVGEGAWLGAAWFACHPLLADASLFVVGVADQLVALGFLLAALALLAGRWPLAVVAVAGAALCKETGFFLAPALVVLGLWGPAPAEGGRLRSQLPLWLSLAAVLGALLALRWGLLGRLGTLPGRAPLGGLSVMQRLPVVGRILYLMLELQAFPIAPSTNYGGFLRQGLQGWSLVAGLGFAALLGLATCLRRRGAPAVCAGIALCGLFPATNLVPIGAAWGNRFLYFPAVGLAGLLACALGAPGKRRAARAGLALALLLLAGLSALRAAESRSAAAFWGRLHARHPADPKPGINLMAALAGGGQRPAALEAGRELLARTADPEVSIALGTLLLADERYDTVYEGARLVEAGIRAQPAVQGGLLPRLRQVYLGLGRKPEALGCVRLMLELGLLGALGPADAELAEELGERGLAARLRAATGG